MAEHKKNARPSSHDKHTSRQKQDKQIKKSPDKNWIHQGKNTNHGSNKNQTKKK